MMAQGKIIVANENGRFAVDERYVKKIIVKIFKLIKRPRPKELEVIFLSDAGIQRLNQRYKRRNRATDVLSFRIEDRGQFLGEIFISTDTAARNAGIFASSFEEEVALYIIHGILHLFGYDDQRPRERSNMSKKERGVLDCLCKTEDLSKVSTRR